MTLTPPFPYFGSKRRAAAAVWQALGDPGLYVEPFAGSLAVLLARPNEAPPMEIVVDTDGFVINWWRAIRANHERVLELSMGPVAETDIEARHQSLCDDRETLSLALQGNPWYYSVEHAAWWWQGVSSWLGSGYATRTSAARQRPHIDRTLKGLYARGCTDERIAHVAARITNAVILSGDWEDAWTRSVTPSILRRFRNNVGVFLDPPYTLATGRASGLYSSDAPLSEAVARFCHNHGSGIRIVLAGYLSEYPTLATAWRVVPWGNHNGYAAGNNDRRDEDVLFLSPACVDIPTPVG